MRPDVAHVALYSSECGLRSLLASSESDSYGGEKGPHSLQDIKSFVCHVLCEYCDGGGHVVNHSCSGSPEEVTLLIDGAGLRQPLSLAQASTWQWSAQYFPRPAETAEPAAAAEPVDPSNLGTVEGRAWLRLYLAAER